MNGVIRSDPRVRVSLDNDDTPSRGRRAGRDDAHGLVFVPRCPTPIVGEWAQ